MCSSIFTEFVKIEVLRKGEFDSLLVSISEKMEGVEVGQEAGHNLRR